MNELTVGSLFSGIGGFDLGFERAGMRTVWFCEQDEFCRRVLAKHWPGVPCFPDVRALVADTDGGGRDQPFASAVAEQAGAGEGGGSLDDGVDPSSPAGGDGRAVPVPVPYVDVLCGGFPCQDISLAGRGAGIDGARSGLWGEYARLIRELRPRYVVVENVAALLARGAGRVLGDLAACGYDAEWDCIPASAVGAPHRRDRLWLVAYPSSDDGGSGRTRGSAAGGQRQCESERSFQVPDADGRRQQEREERDSGPHGPRLEAPFRNDADRLRDDVPYANGQRREGAGSAGPAAGGGRQSCDKGPALADTEEQPVGPGLRASGPGGERWGRSGDGGGEGAAGEPEPGLGRAPDGVSEWLDGSWERGIPRVAVGVPDRNDRLKALGNALVPQIAEWIGRRIVEFEEEMRLVA